MSCCTLLNKELAEDWYSLIDPSDNVVDSACRARRTCHNFRSEVCSGARSNLRERGPQCRAGSELVTNCQDSPISSDSCSSAHVMVLARSQLFSTQSLRPYRTTSCLNSPWVLKCPYSCSCWRNLIHFRPDRLLPLSSQGPATPGLEQTW